VIAVIFTVMVPTMFTEDLFAPEELNPQRKVLDFVMVGDSV